MTADVHQWNIVFSVVHVQFCFGFLHLFIYYCTTFLPARIAANS